jgi:hypothetical protein
MRHRSAPPEAVLALALVAAACGAPDPVAGPLLVDRSATLDATAAQRIERYLGWVRDEYGVDYRVVVDGAGGPASPAAEAERWFRELAVGGATGGRGLLLWVDPRLRRAHIEVGYALEGAVPDLSAAWILDAYLAPRVRAEELPASLEAAIEGLVDRLRPRLDSLVESGATAGSGGAGAGSDLARAPDPPEPPDDPLADRDLLSRADPRAVRDRELRMMAAGRYEPEAPIYDEAWRRTARRGHWSPERLREIARRFDRPYEIASDGDHAVAHYPGARDLGPTLLRREADGWIIDATAGARLIVYDYSNTSWYLVDEPTPYHALLHAAYRLEHGRLQDGRAAWWIAP